MPGLSSGRSGGAMARKAQPKRTASGAFPSGTIIYTTRRLGFVGAFLPSRLVVPLIVSGDRRAARFFEGLPFEPYGIAYDTTRRGCWLADKQNNRVWFVRFSGVDSISAGGEPVEEAIAYTDQSVAEPCHLDFHPQYGLLAGCYGDCGQAGAVMCYDGSTWNRLTPPDFKDHVTHCCWLPDGGYCYVTRSDWVL